MGDVSSREVVGLELVSREGESGFYRGDAAVNDQRRRNLTEAHEDEVEKAHWSARCARLKPDTEEFDQDGKKIRKAMIAAAPKMTAKGPFSKRANAEGKEGMNMVLEVVKWLLSSKVF
jgi:hypothetical protein